MDDALTSGADAPTWPGVEALVARISTAEPRLGRVRLVTVDGPAGSGKTTLAGRLEEGLAAEGLQVTTIHLDDLYEGWTGLGGVWDRLSSWVLEPLHQGRPGRYRRYDWEAEGWAEWHEVPVPDVLVVEGCGSAPRAVDPLAVLRIWVEAAVGQRLQRGLARDGEHMRDHWLGWMASEATHFRTERTRDRADVLLRT